jgi:CRISPR-associated protein Cas5d
MTPSAARGLLEAIFWKPEFTWRVREIWVLKPIRHFSLLRNEVNRRAVAGSAGFLADEERTQRHTLALREVEYLIRADVAVYPAVTEDPAKYRDQFRRRVDRGQCFHRPYFGCREFDAAFAAPSGAERPIVVTDDLGRMLFDLEFVAGSGNVLRPQRAEVERGQLRPRFFEARLEEGVLHVPAALYQPGVPA